MEEEKDQEVVLIAEEQEKPKHKNPNPWPMHKKHPHSRAELPPGRTEDEQEIFPGVGYRADWSGL